MGDLERRTSIIYFSFKFRRLGQYTSRIDVAQLIFRVHLKMEKCFFDCNKDLKSDTTRTLGKKSIETVIAASIERENGKYELLSEIASIQVHEKCYKAYIRD